MKVNWNNMTDLNQLASKANEASNGTFWLSMLFMLFVITLLTTIGWGFEVALLLASFAGLIFGSFLAYSGLIAWHYVLTFAGIILFLLIYIVYTNSRK